MISLLIETLSRIIVLVVIVDVILSYFLPPYNNVRMTLDRIVEPMLKPIRHVVPSFQGIDFSPVILVILVSIIESILVMFFRSIGL